jgi:hypothetical protein
MRTSYIICIVLFILGAANLRACIQTGASTNGGGLAPTVAAQTTGVTVGDYFTFTLNPCESITFSFCNDGGSAGFDTQITILDNAGSTQLGYNDDFCGLQSEFTFDGGAGGIFKVQITQYNCNYTSGATATLSYKLTAPVLTVVDDFTLTNDASSIVVGGENCIQLTPEANDQLACVWNQNQIDFSNPIDLDVTYYFGNNGVNGADGNTFVFKSSNSQCDCGANGAQMGAGGISDALVIEFDTYNNDGTDPGDLTTDHIAVEIDGAMVQSSGDPMPLCGPIDAIVGGAEIDDGNQHLVKLTWDPVTQNLAVFFDGVLRLTCNHDFINNVFGGNSSVTWGVTSATGGLNNQQYFCPSSVIILPVSLTKFNTVCTEDEAQITFSSGEETLLESYHIQRTYDGLLFETIASFAANGSFSDYSFIDKDKVATCYYRLKMNDLDGGESFTELIASECHPIKTFDFNLQYGENGIMVNTEFPIDDDIEIKIMNSSGQVIHSSRISSSSLILPTSNLSSGVYFVRLRSLKGDFDLTK